jgi:hypothetical protein
VGMTTASSSSPKKASGTPTTCTSLTLPTGCATSCPPVKLEQARIKMCLLEKDESHTFSQGGTHDQYH